MNQTESKLYGKYRHYLTAENRHGTHAAERRQNARAKVVAEFNVPYAEVKRIVAEGDKLAGITHEAPKEIDPFNGLEIKRVAVTKLQVGDRVKYTAFFDVDARVIAIDGYRITMHGLRYQNGCKKEKGTFTYDYTPENFNGEKLSVPIVVNRERRVLTNV